MNKFMLMIFFLFLLVLGYAYVCNDDTRELFDSRDKNLQLGVVAFRKKILMSVMMIQGL